MTPPARRRSCVPLLFLLAACERAPEPSADASAPPPETDAHETGNPTMAITIDDLPWVGPLPLGEDRLQATERILAAFRAHEATATGFVNCARAASEDPVLRRWLNAGMRLGNHTAGHLDLNTADVDAWVAEARSCDAFVRDVTGEPFVHFRYPYLHRGPTEARYRTGRETLEALDSPTAPVTIDTGDYILDDPYVAALRAGDDARAAEIREAYLDHVLRATRHYQEVARERVGRDVAHVLLLHANALLADGVGPLLDTLSAQGFRFVPLEEALRDSVYALEDDYIGPDGLSWLYRFEPAVPEAERWDREEAAGLRARFP